jgi:predicted short-subunit dehydrogenase-like oxidoreductase (DUF2520 family)
MISYKISFIGAGKLADALCMEFFNAGYQIINVISETGKSASVLAQKCKASWSTVLSIPEQTDILIVAVPDHKLKEVLHNVICRDDIVVAHTAGSFGLDPFHERLRHTGVLYPLQTFSEGRKVDFNEIPFFIEASDPCTGFILESIANKIGKSANFSDSESRRMLHLAGVFVNNFTNHMLAEGKEIAMMAGFSFEELIPLLQETINKAVSIGPENAQTGPAIRNDRNTIEKHLELLSFSPELRNIYNDISNSIIKRYKK